MNADLSLWPPPLPQRGFLVFLGGGSHRRAEQEWFTDISLCFKCKVIFLYIGSWSLPPSGEINTHGGGVLNRMDESMQQTEHVQERPPSHTDFQLPGLNRQNVLIDVWRTGWRPSSIHEVTMRSPWGHVTLGGSKRRQHGKERKLNRVKNRKKILNLNEENNESRRNSCADWKASPAGISAGKKNRKWRRGTIKCSSPVKTIVTVCSWSFNSKANVENGRKKTNAKWAEGRLTAERSRRSVMIFTPEKPKVVGE